MAEEMITIPKWKFKTIENALRLAHRINNCSTKETVFDREVVKAYDYAKSALAKPSSVPQANELLPLISGSALDMKYCPFCGEKMEHEIYTDSNSDLMCKVGYCGRFKVSSK